MGKWNCHRRTWRPKNYYRDQRIPSPPTYYDTEFKFRGAWKNANLPWEERFCISVGIPWEKVVNAKKYISSYDNVLKWNDSAGEATFCEAKKRFWAKINDIPTDVPQPNPDMYDEDIDWNPKIDVDLIKDLDLAYYNPDEAGKLEIYNAANKNDGFASGCIIGLDDNKNPNNGWKCSNDHENKNISDPWERRFMQDEKDVKDAWGGGGEASSSWQKDVTWGDGARNNSWHWNQFNNRDPVKQRGDYSGNSFGRGQWHGQQRDAGYGQGGQRYNRNGWGSNVSCKKHEGEQYTGNHGNGWGSNVSCRKREGEQYTGNYKCARVQYDAYREGNQYRRC